MAKTIVEVKNELKKLHERQTKFGYTKLIQLKVEKRADEYVIAGYRSNILVVIIHDNEYHAAKMKIFKKISSLVRIDQTNDKKATSKQ